MEYTERPRDECGVFGIYNHPEAAKITYFGLYALQHRGQESAGIDFSTIGELIAARKSIEELRDFLGLDTLHYLSLEGLLESTGVENPEDNFCKACFDGVYPVEFDENISKNCLEQ